MKTLRKIISSFVVFKWLLTTQSLSLSGKFFMLINKVVLAKNGVVVSYDDSDRSKIICLIKKIKDEIKIFMEINECYQIYMAVRATSKIKGDIAEVGVARGGSSKIICESKGNRTLYLFDTFEGLSDLSEKDEKGYFYKGEFAYSLDDVKEYLKKYKKVYFYKGLFPHTAQPIKDKKFSFVNLDVDLYESTLASLKFFYPRISF